MAGGQGGRNLFGVLDSSVGLLTDTEALDRRAVSLDVLALHVVQQATTTTDELQQAAATVMVFAVGLEMLGQLDNPVGQQSYLNLGRTGVAIMGAVLFNDLSLDRFILRQDTLLPFFGADSTTA